MSRGRVHRNAVIPLVLATLSLFSGACGDADASDESRAPADGSRPGATSIRPGSAHDPHGPFFRADAEHGELAGFALDEAVVGPAGDLRIADGKGHSGTDPRPTGYHPRATSFYNGGTYHYATVTSREWTSSTPFDSVTPSFEATTPLGTWIHMKLAARIDGAWTKDYSLGVWASDDETVRRHSVEAQKDATGNVATDTLELTRPADALRITTILFAEVGASSPVLRAVSAVATMKSKGASSAATTSNMGDLAARGKNLAVPKRSQMIYPDGGEAWCSPTSTSMLLGYWADTLAASALRETPPEAAARCQDHVYEGTGNWAFNTAHAAALADGRLHAAVTRLGSFAQVEPLIAAGIPVAISIRYEKGELSRSPINRTDGHLIVVRGFAADGSVVCNDPAFGDDASVEVTYDRDELTTVWQRSLGTTYLVWPRETSLPLDPAGAFY